LQSHLTSCRMISSSTSPILTRSQVTG
jgi:hypothetical protein